MCVCVCVLFGSVCVCHECRCIFNHRCKCTCNILSCHAIPGSAGKKTKHPSSLAKLSSAHAPSPTTSMLSRSAVTSEPRMGVVVSAGFPMKGRIHLRSWLSRDLGKLEFFAAEPGIIYLVYRLYRHNSMFIHSSVNMNT